MEKFEFQAIPVFGILNYTETIEFYIHFLGFIIDWQHRFGPSDPVYMQISHHGLVLHLSENKRFRTGVFIFVETKGIDAFRDELKNKTTKYLPEVTVTNWNTKQMEIEDPFGNLLRFNENLLL